MKILESTQKIRKSIYITANIKPNKKINFIATKQSPRTIAVSHAEQFP